MSVLDIHQQACHQPPVSPFFSPDVKSQESYLCQAAVPMMLSGSRSYQDPTYPSRGLPRYTKVTSVFPQTADTAGNRHVLGSPRNATPRNSKPRSNASVLSSMSRITRILSPIWKTNKYIQIYLFLRKTSSFTLLLFQTYMLVFFPSKGDEKSRHKRKYFGRFFTLFFPNKILKHRKIGISNMI